MPIYEYRCDECQQTFEEWQQDFEERKVRCPVCGNLAKREISNTSFILKGGGWYATDYAGGHCCNRNGNGAGEASASDGTSKASAAKTAYTKPAPASQSQTAKAAG